MFQRIITNRAFLSSGRHLSSFSASSSISPSVFSSFSVRSFSASAAPTTSNNNNNNNNNNAVPTKTAPLVSKPAQAVFKAAQKDSGKDTVEKVGNNISEFVSAFEKIPVIRFIATNPSLTPADKKKKFQSLFPKLNYHPVAQEILLYYLSIGQGHKIKNLVKDYKKLAAYYRNEVIAVITSAEKLSNAQVNKITAAIKAKLLPGEKLVLEQKVEPSIMGGLVVRVGDKAVDLSVASQIRKIDQAIRSV